MFINIILNLEQLPNLYFKVFKFTVLSIILFWLGLFNFNLSYYQRYHSFILGYKKTFIANILYNSLKVVMFYKS